jgi:hypothetical protein
LVPSSCAHADTRAEPRITIPTNRLVFFITRPFCEWLLCWLRVGCVHAALSSTVEVKTCGGCHRRATDGSRQPNASQVKPLRCIHRVANPCPSATP